MTVNVHVNNVHVNKVQESLHTFIFRGFRVKKKGIDTGELINLDQTTSYESMAFLMSIKIMYPRNIISTGLN